MGMPHLTARPHTAPVWPRLVSRLPSTESLNREMILKRTLDVENDGYAC